MRDSQVIGGPEWINTEVYEIQAKAEDGSIPVQTGPPDLTVPDAYAFRTQSLIDERFQMKMHRETREFPVYELVVARGGPKWQLSDDQSIPKMPDPSTPPSAPPQPGTFPARGGISMGRNASGSTLHAVGAPLSNILSVLSQIVGRPIVDKTELKAGLYDINLQYVDSGPIAGGPVGPEPSVTVGDPVGASIFTAVQEQLGLRFVSSKGPLEVLVIDSVQKPTLN
jgi:uncharacterized protein (TIGR03435 family)